MLTACDVKVRHTKYIHTHFNTVSVRIENILNTKLGESRLLFRFYPASSFLSFCPVCPDWFRFLIDCPANSANWQLSNIRQITAVLDRYLQLAPELNESRLKVAGSSKWPKKTAFIDTLLSR